MENISKCSLDSLFELLPVGDSIDWCRLEKSSFNTLFEMMKKIPQEYDYHREGDVYTHTKMVASALVNLQEYKVASREDKLILFLASLLHDIGKIRRTRIEDGMIISPGHSLKGAIMTREFLWKEMGLAGSEYKRNLRESVCLLVRNHSFPPYAIKTQEGVYKLLKIVANGRLAPQFTAKKLYILSKADILGRICDDSQEQLERVEFFKILSEENNCFENPYNFVDDYTQRAYFLGKTKWKEDSLFDNSWGEVILLSGLPGTGKDNYIMKNIPDLPTVSLDDIRKKLGILPTDEQGKVVAYAQEQAKEFLRKKQPFVWNATNITAQIRQKQISLFERYNAKVRTIFLETEWQEGLSRNEGREDVVPQVEVEKMLSKLELPERHESEKVEWIIN